MGSIRYILKEQKKKKKEERQMQLNEIYVNQHFQ